MQTVKSGSWVRMALAFAAVLLVGGSGMVFAAGPNPSYVPASSVLIGPTSIAKGGTAAYVLRVSFVNDGTLDFPPTMGATFTAVNGTATGNSVTFSSTANKARVTGTFAQNGNQVTSSTIVTLQ